MSMTSPAIELLECHADTHQAYYAKGHLDLVEFAQAVEGFHGAPLKDWEPARHEWWRCVPDPSGDSLGFFHPATPGSRGAFRVTTTEQR